MLREELTSESGAVLSCPFEYPGGKVCGMTERLRRAGDKSRELCELHYNTHGKRDERAELRHHERAVVSLDALAEVGMVADEGGNIPLRSRAVVDEWVNPPDADAAAAAAAEYEAYTPAVVAARAARLSLKKGRTP